MLPDVASTRNGLSTLGPQGVALIEALQQLFGRMAAQCGASVARFPPLLRVDDLHTLDYFRNFPHLGLAAAPLSPQVLPQMAAGAEAAVELPSTQLEAARYMLPSAACYGAYCQLREHTVKTPSYVTTTATCYRNETAYEGLERLWAFTMQEIVCIGSLDDCRAHLERSLAQIQDLGAQLGIPLSVEIATDPFFDPQSSVARFQQRAPTKRELLYRGLAISSVNFHRNFFGERFHIHDESGAPAFTACVAFGLERWMHMLLHHFDGDAGTAIRAVQGLRLKAAGT